MPVSIRVTALVLASPTTHYKVGLTPLRISLGSTSPTYHPVVFQTSLAVRKIEPRGFMKPYKA